MSTKFCERRGNRIHLKKVGFQKSFANIKEKCPHAKTCFRGIIIDLYFHENTEKHGISKSLSSRNVESIESKTPECFRHLSVVGEAMM